MKANPTSKPQVVVECVDAVWTLWVDGTPLLRTMDGRGIRLMAAHLRRVLSLDALDAVSGN